MNGKKLIIVILFILYIAVSISTNTVKLYGDYYDRDYDLKNRSKRYNYNYTFEINRTILSKIDSDLEKKYKYIDLFEDFYLYSPAYFNSKLYITNADDLDNFLKNNKITNTLNINLKNPKFTLPIDDDEYKKVFNNNYTKVKKQASVIGKDERGYSKFDISPDAIIIVAVDNDIIGYAHIDNRLLDTRQVMNMINDEDNLFEIVKTKDGTYNKYALVIAEEKDYELYD